MTFVAYRFYSILSSGFTEFADSTCTSNHTHLVILLLLSLFIVGCNCWDLVIKSATICPLSHLSIYPFPALAFLYQKFSNPFSASISLRICLSFLSDYFLAASFNYFAHYFLLQVTWALRPSRLLYLPSLPTFFMARSEDCLHCADL